MPPRPSSGVAAFRVTSSSATRARDELRRRARARSPRRARSTTRSSPASPRRVRRPADPRARGRGTTSATCRRASGTPARGRDARAARARSARLCSSVLREADPRIDEDRIPANAGGLGARRPARAGASPTSRDDVVVVRVRLHRARRSPHVHRDEAGIVFGDDPQHVGVGVPPETSLTIARARRRARRTRTAALVVSMLTGTPSAAASAAHDGDDACAAPRRRRPARHPAGSTRPPTSSIAAPAAASARPCAIAASAIEEAATVGERVGRDVHDTHHRPARQRPYGEGCGSRGRRLAERRRSAPSADSAPARRPGPSSAITSDAGRRRCP